MWAKYFVRAIRYKNYGWLTFQTNKNKANRNFRAIFKIEKCQHIT